MTLPKKPIEFFWEDLEPGQRHALGSVSPTREEILAFAAQFDPQPFHLDDEAARDSVFGALCASGWHTCSLAMRLMVDNFLSRAASLGSPGLDGVKWFKPVFPGDVLSMSLLLHERKPMSRRPDVGLVRTEWEMTNQRGERVLQIDAWAMFRRRTPAEPAAAPATGH